MKIPTLLMICGIVCTGCASSKTDTQSTTFEPTALPRYPVESACRNIERYALSAALAKAADVEQEAFVETLDTSHVIQGLQQDVDATIDTMYFLPIESEEDALAAAAYAYNICVEKNSGY